MEMRTLDLMQLWHISLISRPRTIFIVWNTKFRKNSVCSTSFNLHISSHFNLTIEP